VVKGEKEREHTKNYKGHAATSQSSFTGGQGEHELIAMTGRMWENCTVVAGRSDAVVPPRMYFALLYIPKAASDVAVTHLPPTRPICLGLALNFLCILL